MEIELKYSIDDDSIANAVFDYIISNSYSQKKRPESKNMFAIYYDTCDGDLKSEKIVFRTRREGDEYFATVKHGGKVKNGLHERSEVNLKISEEEFFEYPTLDVLSQMELSNVIDKIQYNKPLVPVIKMEFCRIFINVNYKDSSFECSYDKGIMKHNSIYSTISEVEIELISGSKEDLFDFGDIIQKKFSLKFENKSKFERCI